MNLDFILNLPVLTVLAIVVVAILVDAFLGAFSALKGGRFDVRELPRFLGTSVLPYVGGLIVVGLAAEYVGKPYVLMFHAVAMAVLAKYLAEIKDKIKALFQIEIS